MEHKQGTFKGINNLSLYYQCWLPAEKTRAILLLVHGLAEHSSRYKNFAEYFVSRGYAIYSYDQRGHGRSDGLRCYVNSFSEYINDLKIFVDMVHKEYIHTSLFLIGHSMGSIVAIEYVIDHQQDLNGLLLSGATLKIGANISPLLIGMAGIISALLPKTGTTVIDASAISQDKSVVDAYVNDPLVYHGKIPARLGSELIKTAQNLTSKLSKIKLPVLIMHGTSDRLSEPKGSQILYELVSSEDKTLKLYNGLYHEVFNEPKRELVFRDIEQWLASHS